MVKNKKDKGQKWDGKSRVSNDLYRKRYDEIFKKVTDDNAEEFVHRRKNPDEGIVTGKPLIFHPIFDLCLFYFLSSLLSKYLGANLSMLFKGAESCTLPLTDIRVQSDLYGAT